MRQNVRQLEIHGMKMNYIRFGKEAAKPFVIIPGLSIKSVLDSSGMIMSAYAKVAQEYEVFLFDRREDVPEGYSLSDMAADTLAALRAAKEAGVRTLAIVNVVGSTIAREADNVLYTVAGPEIAVATTTPMVPRSRPIATRSSLLVWSLRMRRAS